ncbi:MAG TPA: hypothetical protein VFK79_07290 [Xanthobacteraceae bacterium]|nr:hypothetical protein [Xanthobacteraceae bacterium]
MKKLMLSAAAAALLTPALFSLASAQSVSVRVGDPGYRAYSQQRVVVSGPRCRTVTVKTKSYGKTVIKKVRKCG